MWGEVEWNGKVDWGGKEGVRKGFLAETVKTKAIQKPNTIEASENICMYKWDLNEITK